GVALGHFATAQPGDLRKDEPHPVAPLLAGPQLGQRLGIDALLRLDEAFERLHFGQSATSKKPNRARFGRANGPFGSFSDGWRRLVGDAVAGPVLRRV